MPSNEIATIDTGGFLALSHSSAEIQEILNDNLAGQDVNEFDLPRIKVPSGGGAIWEIPSLTGPEASKELVGIVVGFKLTRAYWPRDAATGTPPACRSNDTITGIGSPGGDCRTCPHAEYGTAVDDKGEPAPGQACNAKEIWFLLREGSFLPVVVSLPATSLKDAKAYRLLLAGSGIKLTSVATRLTLAPEKNAKGDSYSKGVFALGGMLSPEDAARAKEYAELLRPIFERTAAAVAAEQGGSEPPSVAAEQGPSSDADGAEVEEPAAA